MLKSVKKILKKILPLPAEKLISAMDKFTKRILKKHDQILTEVETLSKHLDQQQEMIKKLSVQNELLLAELQRTKCLGMVANATCNMQDQKTMVYAWDVWQKRLPKERSSLAFLELFYFLHDVLKETNVKGILEQEYVNSVLDACLHHLHMEENAADRQLIYDALKNEVFDALELTGYDASFYYNKAAYREMQEIAGRAYDYDYFSVLSKPFYEQALAKWFFLKTGKKLDLQNPVTFNEKMQWLKLYDSTPLKTKLADKYAVRSWISEKIGEEYLVPLLGVWSSFDEIEFDKLPDQFALKTNHGSSYNLIVSDKEKLDKQVAKKKFDKWMDWNFAYKNGLELHYLNIEPYIIAEQYMAEFTGDIFDYRFFCFNGQPQYIWVDIGSGTNHHKRNIYDINWNFMDYTVNYPNLDYAVERPDNYNEMLEIATKLSRGFAFVRVDLYNVDGKIYFGEMTFTSQSGVGKWDSEEQNIMYGSLIQLPPKSPVPIKKDHLE